MSVLRIRCPLVDAPLTCEWALIEAEDTVLQGASPIAELPQRASRVEVIIPAADVLITRAHLPPMSTRRAASTLAFAIEDEMVSDPEAQHVSRLGSVRSADVLAVVHRAQLTRVLDALTDAGIAAYDVHCETLLLPFTPGEWSLAWDGYEGFMRTGVIEGGATDAGDRHASPLSVRLMLEEAAASGNQPSSIALFVTAPDAAPDFEAWQQELGVPLRFAGPWDWRTARSPTQGRLAQDHGRARVLSRVAVRLRPAAWIAAAALAIHAVGLLADWSSLAAEQRTLRRQMEARFRVVFPDAVSVVDPALQMRRKVAEARHAAGQTDSGDFLPMISHIAAAVKDLPSGSVRIASYELGRLTIELGGVQDEVVRRVASSLLQVGLSVDVRSASSRSADATVVLTVSGA